jgi:hypothetical protein
MFAFSFAFLFPDVESWSLQVGVINFGSPRVGDSDFSDYFTNVIGSIVRITHQDDIVPHLPPELFNFDHVYTETWNHDGTWISFPFFAF